jgi:hypothetical protein
MNSVLLCLRLAGHRSERLFPLFEEQSLFKPRVPPPAAQIIRLVVDGIALEPGEHVAI